MTSLQQRLQDNPFQGYAYAYPHKSAYRPLKPAQPLAPLWQQEPRDALFLYIHLPFCEMRCGFCNLFTEARPAATLADQYLQALQRQMDVMDDILGQRQFARFALGGGTPTYLSAQQLGQLLSMAQRFGADPAVIPTSVETSPQTATHDRLALLANTGVERISIGIQSFAETELKTGLLRNQSPTEAAAALDRIRQHDFPILNVDLIYGIPGQTLDSWLQSLERTLSWQPEELYLYPLYIRPLTGMSKAGRDGNNSALNMYRQGRTRLLAAGYEQVSQRMFRQPNTGNDGPSYCCQDDAMVGLGSGARSYTRSLHYSSEYAVGRPGVKAIIEDYLQRPAEQFQYADYGIQLNQAEQQRRYLIQSLLTRSGLDHTAFQQRFGQLPTAALPELQELLSLELVSRHDQHWRLTELGFERADTIGPWLASPDMQQRMAAATLQ